MADRVVVVHEIRTVEIDGYPQEYMVVVGDDGYREEIPVVREDTPENSREFEGSELPPPEGEPEEYDGSDEYEEYEA